MPLLFPKLPEDFFIIYIVHIFELDILLASCVMKKKKRTCYKIVVLYCTACLEELNAVHSYNMIDITFRAVTACAALRSLHIMQRILFASSRMFVKYGSKK